MLRLTATGLKEMNFDDLFLNFSLDFRTTSSEFQCILAFLFQNIFRAFFLFVSVLCLLIPVTSMLR